MINKIGIFNGWLSRIININNHCLNACLAKNKTPCYIIRLEGKVNFSLIYKNTTPNFILQIMTK